MKNIIIYTTETCAFCKVEMQWLDSLGIKYTYKMIDQDDDAMKELQKLNVGLSVPVTVIDGVTIRGFDRPALMSELGI